MVSGLFSQSRNINGIDEDFRFSTERHHAKRPAWIWQKRPTDRSVCFWRTTPLSGMNVGWRSVIGALRQHVRHV